MSKAFVKIKYRHIIDNTCQTSFEKDVFHDTYSEFLMQAQSYNQDNRFTTFSQLVNNNPKANSLHYKVGFAIGLYVKDLNNIIPVLKDSLDKTVVSFAMHQFEIIDSDITNKAAHKVAITYTSQTLLLLDTIGKYFLLSNDEKANGVNEPAETFMLKMQPGLSVCNYQPVFELATSVS